ncbi:MAG TPA: hypothetical protein PK098_07040 [Phycisphaerales bacterium]|nr:hypothetical protein [Phycisphaerales bacterium]
MSFMPDRSAPQSSTDASLDARAMIAEFQRSGLTREDAKRNVAKALDDPAIVQRWAEWTNLPDRDELRLRLEVIARANTWNEAFAPFITFFFRASVADLYQPAAVALGRHLHRSPKLREYLAAYARHRNVNLTKPIPLSGNRTNRRFIIALAAAAAQPECDLTLVRQPLPVEPKPGGGGRLALPNSAPDLAILIFALDLMVQSMPSDASVRTLAADALERVPCLSARLVGRTVVQRYGSLLVHVGGERTATDWLRMLDMQMRELRECESNPFASRVAGLIRLDDVMRTASLLAEPWPAHIMDAVRTIAEPLERRYCIARLITWWKRERHERPEWYTAALNEVIASASHQPVHSGSVLTPEVVMLWLEAALAEAHTVHPRFFASGKPIARLDLLDKLLAQIATSHVWLSADESTRALLTVLLIDQSQHLHAGQEQVEALLRRRGIDIPDDAMAPTLVSEVSGAPNAITTTVLLRVLTWEKPGAEDLFDARTLHRIDDPRVLLALLPTRRRSDVLSIVADAMEHQIRWRLRRDPDFSLETFLYHALVRQPHAAFFEALRTVSEGRTYQRTDGTEVDVLTLINRLAQEAAWNPNDPMPSPCAQDISLCRSMTRLREGLAALLQQEADLRSRLVRLFDLIGEPSPDRVARAGTVIELLEQFSHADEPLLQDGYPAWSDVTLAQLEHELISTLARLRALSHAVLPDDWSRIDDSREALTTLRAMLDELLPRLARLLPHVEATLLLDIRASLHRELFHWAELLDHATEAWPDSSLRLHGFDARAFNAVMTAIGEVDHQIVRRHLFLVLWKSMRHAAWETDLASRAYELQRDALDALLAHPLWIGGHKEDADVLHDAASRTWAELAQHAMERNEEMRVTELVEGTAYSEIRRRSAAADALRTARTWCYDRYIIRPTVTIASDLDVLDERQGHGRRGVFAPFLAHYSAVWISLMVGAILMLDFGDAWKGMAEIGDVRGIIITFILGIGGAFGYIYWNLRQKSRLSPGESVVQFRLSHLRRAAVFAMVCLLYSFSATSLLWLLLSRTDEVIHGAGAIGHIIVWSGFAMFVGVFFGLIAGET